MTQVSLLFQLIINVFAGAVFVALAIDFRQPVLHPFLIQKPSALACVAGQAKR